MIRRIGLVYCLAFFLVTFFLTEYVAQAQSIGRTTIIGKVLTSHRWATDPFAAERMEVILFRVVGGDNQNNYLEVSRTYTGSEGEFYFRAEQPGNYIIQIEGKNYGVSVTGDQAVINVSITL